MVKIDGGTMHYALEARAPFLDQKIWEFAAALPAQVRFHGGNLKAVLREIVRRRVGPDVAFREKQGFTVPVERWLAERWSGMLDRLRQGTALERDGWVCRGLARSAASRCAAPAVDSGPTVAPARLGSLAGEEPGTGVRRPPFRPFRAGHRGWLRPCGTPFNHVTFRRPCGGPRARTVAKTRN